MAVKRNQTLLAHLIREAEKHIIYEYLCKHGGNKTKAAEALGVSHRHIQRRCVALGIEVGSTDDGGVAVRFKVG